MGFEQDYTGSRWSAGINPVSALSQTRKPTEGDRRRKEKDEKAQNYGMERKNG